MAVYKCKMCGGTLEVQPGEKICECEYCGAVQTIPSVQEENLQNLFNRANTLRIKAEFDKAAEIYEKIIQVDETEAEAYWGLVLCKYGVEYVEDPATFKRVPTCHRTSYESVVSDEDYRSAVQYADESQKGIYESEAKAIDEIQKGILSIASTESDYDIFICYKEADENGGRTVDSTIANDIYYELTQEGFKVFYAAITLEDKLGTEYEPYIFSALNSAKVMLVIGTKPEYFTAVWVKNEWSRFLKLMKNDRRRTLIPCYRDMDPYELPDEFAHLQAEDMSKIGFMNDIIRGVKKLIGGQKDDAAKLEEESAAGPSEIRYAGTTETLLKRASMALEDKDWQRADDFCEQALNLDPENGCAYAYKLCAEFQCGTLSKITREIPEEDSDRISASSNFRRALSFSNGDLKSELEQIQKEMDEKAENNIKHLKELRERADTVSKLVYIDSISMGIKTDSTVVLGGTVTSKYKWDRDLGWKDINKVYYGQNHFFGIKHDGTVVERSLYVQEFGVQDWEDIVDIDEDRSNDGGIVGLKSDGTLIIKQFDPNDSFEEIKNWKDIISISVHAGAGHYIGLKTDGTVVVSGYEFNTLDWHDIISIDAEGDNVIGLRADGSVVAAGSNKYGECNVQGWKDIVQIACSDRTTVGLKSNGTVVATGNNQHNQCDVGNWRDIVAVGVGSNFTVGLKSDGTVVWNGCSDINEEPIKKADKWEEIVSLIVDHGYIVGIKADGTAVSATGEKNDPLDLSGWKLFNDISTLEEERRENKEKQEEVRLKEEESAEEERKKKIAALEEEKESLTKERPEQSGFFADRKRKKIDDRITEIDNELEELASK